MKYKNVNSFKAKIKNIAQGKGIPAQQIQQNYLIEQILRLISKSNYKECFIIKGGYLISHIIGVDKRTTMDLDVTLKAAPLSQDNLSLIFKEILSLSKDHNFLFKLDSILPIRKSDEYGGFQIKITASFNTLQETVFVAVTTGDRITPHEIQYSVKSIFSGDQIEILSYNIETVLAEKLESIISRGAVSTRPRDRYDLFTIWKLHNDEINLPLLKKALANTATKRHSMDVLEHWREQVNAIKDSDYQKQLWVKYQRSFKYAQEISFSKSVEIIETIMLELA